MLTHHSNHKLTTVLIYVEIRRGERKRTKTIIIQQMDHCHILPNHGHLPGRTRYLGQANGKRLPRLDKIVVYQ